MDPYTERDMIECLRSIAVSLKSMDAKLDDISSAIREANADLILEEDSGDEEDDPTEKFAVDEEDTEETSGEVGEI